MKQDTYTKTPRKRRRRRAPMDGLTRGILIAFLIAGIATAALAFGAVREMTKTWSITGDLPGLAINAPAQPSEGTGGGAVETPVAAAPVSSIPPEPWDGASRVTILIMGLDYRDWEAGNGAPRTDSMILLTIDPITKQAGMLSIPRDLWVNIPGYGSGRINTAYQLGEGARLPGGGPALAMQTVEEFLGVDIQYYAQIDFQTFVDFIDLIGGVEVDVPYDIKVDVIGKPHPVIIEAGHHNMPGAYALAYARARYTEGGDFDRAARQQQIIKALAHHLVQGHVRKLLLNNATELWNIMIQGIRTNISFEEAFKLGLLALQVNIDEINQGIIAPPEMVTLENGPDGSNILKPITQNIRILRDEIFTDGTLVGPAAANVSPEDLVAQEDASVGVYNGTSTSGLAGDTQAFLESKGIRVTAVDNADLVSATRIIDYTGNPYTVAYLVSLMNIQETRIFSRYDPNSPVDIEVIVGPDWTIPQN